MRGENPRRKYRQWRSVKSIIGATDTLRSIAAAEFAAEIPIVAELSKLHVAAGLPCMPGSLAVAGER